MNQGAEIIKLWDHEVFRDRVYANLEKVIAQGFDTHKGKTITAKSAGIMINKSVDRVIQVFPHMKDRRLEVMDQVSQIVLRQFVLVREK